MSPSLFRRGEKTEAPDTEPEEVKVTELDWICGDDKEVCKALLRTMFLDPRKIAVTTKDAAKRAADAEKKKDSERARMWYHIAGGLALWEGDTAKVKQYFGKCAKLAPEMGYELINKIPEKAVAKAQEYYKQHLK